MARRNKKKPEAEILAAGGVVVRERKGCRELAVIHRPRHKDWSLPKGKLDSGEDFQAAALREVREETGQRCELGRELPAITYKDKRGRTKLVRYWLMRPEKKGKTAFKPNAEVDELRWLELGEALELLDYEHDRELVRKALKRRRLFQGS